MKVLYRGVIIIMKCMQFHVCRHAMDSNIVYCLLRFSEQMVYKKISNKSSKRQKRKSLKCHDDNKVPILNSIISSFCFIQIKVHSQPMTSYKS